MRNICQKKMWNARFGVRCSSWANFLWLWRVGKTRNAGPVNGGLPLREKRVIADSARVEQSLFSPASTSYCTVASSRSVFKTHQCNISYPVQNSSKRFRIFFMSLLATSGHCGPVLVTFGHFWSLLVTSGHFWPLLATSGHFWPHFLAYQYFGKTL